MSTHSTDDNYSTLNNAGRDAIQDVTACGCYNASASDIRNLIDVLDSENGTSRAAATAAASSYECLRSRWMSPWDSR
jgi:hypothetical protein